MSLEQMPDFHQIRRIARVFAPEFRILSNPNLEARESVLDIRKKTIEVSEYSSLADMAGSLCFQLGHLILYRDPDFALFFGQGIKDWKGTADELIEVLSGLGVRADHFASRWATDILCAYFHEEGQKTAQNIQDHVWSKDQWKEYFSRVGKSS